MLDSSASTLANELSAVSLKSLDDVLLERRATRHFTDESVPEKVLHQILSAGAQAPSGYNLQPWRFIVVRDKAARERLKKAAMNQGKVAEAGAVIIALGLREGWKAHLDEIFAESARRGALPADNLEQQKKEVIEFLSKIDPAVWVNRHVMIAFTTMMLTAEALGWDTAPMEGLDPAAVRTEFGIPEAVEVIALLAVGRAQQPDSPYPGRLPVEKIAFAERFGEAWQPNKS